MSKIGPSNKRIPKLSIKTLESNLQNLDEFERPKTNLEQYATPPHIAALVLNTIDETYDDLSGKFVADLGCGTGRLSIGSLLCGASMVVGFDIDQEALDSALQNVNDFFSSEDECDDIASVYRNCQEINFVRADLASSLDPTERQGCFMLKKFDTVVMNPPFGTKCRGLDMLFLQQAISLTDNVVYSLHKTSSRDVSLSFLFNITLFDLDSHYL